jgi:SAM-dependent methyltransferase
MDTPIKQPKGPKAATCGEPSYVWRDGQARRLRIIQAAAGKLVEGRVLDNGCGVGMYTSRLAQVGGQVIGLEFDLERAAKARKQTPLILSAAGECLPFKANCFHLILSHEVLEHVRDDLLAAQEIVRVLKPGGRLVLFAPNRGYPFETHGIFWKGKYHFGNVPLVNYLPLALRDKLAPHVRIYNRKKLNRLFKDTNVTIISKTIIFGGYDNIIGRWPRFGKVLRAMLQWFEKTPLRIFGLSHIWVIEKRS